MRSISLFFLITLSSLGYSLPEDKNKLMHLSASTVDLSQATHRGSYSGDVKLDQGTTHLRATTAMTQGDNNNKLVYAVATGESGHQAHFWTQVALNKPLLHAYADVIKYYPNKNLIELLGNARVIQGEHSFLAPKIRFDIKTHHVLSSSEGKQRTTIIIHPGKVS